MVNTNSISRTVQSLVDNDLSLQDALQKDYSNYSAIARMLKPRIEEILGKAVKLESVITAVKRAKTSYKTPARGVVEVVAKTVLNIRTDVAKISIEKTHKNLEKVRRSLANFSAEFLHMTEGMSAITLIFDQRLFSEVCSVFQDRDILDRRQNLAAIILHSPIELIGTPGCAQLFYGTVSRKHINIEETVSCFTDTIMVVKMEEVNTAFSALTRLISDARIQIKHVEKRQTNTKRTPSILSSH